ncbi:hypothetical protein ACH9EU_08475 [Kocuria sp. M1R5S2]|uniref:hypothetical protein n=1 Tax=Kocuria rhizosphaerae TaxID=3376285 RepID=UPI0037ACBCE7
MGESVQSGGPRVAAGFWVGAVVTGVLLAAVFWWAGLPWWFAVLAGACPVLFLGGIVLAAQRSRKAGEQADPGAYGITADGLRTRGHLEVDRDVSELPELVTQAVDPLRGFELTSIDDRGARLETGPSARTFGLVIRLRFTSLTPGEGASARSRIEASSLPAIKTAVSDFGDGR